jgi:hypothetical protein
MSLLYLPQNLSPISIFCYETDLSAVRSSSKVRQVTFSGAFLTFHIFRPKVRILAMKEGFERISYAKIKKIHLFKRRLFALEQKKNGHRCSHSS